MGSAAENLAGIRPLLTAVTAFRVPDGADVIENPPNFDSFGLAEGQESFRIDLKDKTGAAEVLRFGKTTDNGEKIFAQLNQERFVVKLPAKALEPLKKLVANPSVMRDRNLATFPGRR